MSDALHLANPPIVEAVIDIDCDLPPEVEFEGLETQVRDAYRSHYKKFRKRFAELHEIKTTADASPSETSMKRTMDAFQLVAEDEKQIVQVRRLGYSFNRLAPYPGLNDLLPEVRRTWEIFCAVILPRQIRRIQLRYINRILIPMPINKIELGEYVRCGPQLPDEDGLTLNGFLNQYSAVENATGLNVHTVLTRQPDDVSQLCLIFDNAASDDRTLEMGDWELILERITALRLLKNRVFENTLTPKCLNLFR